MDPAVEPVAAVYVHAPFCVRRCPYCDFAVNVRSERGADEWIEAVAAELDFVRREELFELAPRLSSLYLGGGTPSLLGSGAIEALAGVLGRHRLADPELELTAEANPESFDAGVAAGWREAGLNRLSLGAQTFHEPALRWMGRLHGPDGPAWAVREARRAGITNVSVDLIFGLPPHLGRSWTDDLERALSLDVPHVSLYGLSVEPGTPLGRAVAEGWESAVDEEQYREEFLEASERMRTAGYEHYEVSNFARPGYEARHNAVYWEGRPYLGLGNGAHSYRHPLRRWNVRDWDQYRVRVLEGRGAEEGREELGPAEAGLERIWLGLRTRSGLASSDLDEGQLARVEAWRRRGLAADDATRARLTPLGWLELDRLSVELDAAGSGAKPSQSADAGERG